MAPPVGLHSRRGHRGAFKSDACAGGAPYGRAVPRPSGGAAWGGIDLGLALRLACPGEPPHDESDVVGTPPSWRARTRSPVQVVDPDWIEGRRGIESFFIQEVDRDKLVLAGKP